MSRTFLDEIINMTAGESFAGVEAPAISADEVNELMAESAVMYAEAVADNSTFDGELYHAAIVTAGEAMGDTVEQAKALGYRMKGSAKKVFAAIVKFFKSMISWFTGVEGDLKGVAAKAKETVKRLEKSTGTIKDDDNSKEFKFIDYKFSALKERLTFDGVAMAALVLDTEEVPSQVSGSKIIGGYKLKGLREETDVTKLKERLTEAKAIKEKILDSVSDAKSDMADYIKGEKLDGMSGGEIDVTSAEIKSKALAKVKEVAELKVNLKINKEFDKAVKELEKFEKEINKDTDEKNANANTYKISILSSTLSTLATQRKIAGIEFQALKTSMFKTITLGEKIAAAHNKA